MAPVLLLLGLCGGLTLQAGPAMRYLQDAADALHAPHTYVEQVLPAGARPR
jgi:multicomponent K+:H+ antiporter subunit D